METISKIPFNLTQNAKDEILHLKQQLSEDKAKFLRIGVKGGGCAGFSYILDFDNKSVNDNVYLIDNLVVIIEKSHEIYLNDIEIDFKKGLENRGFTFNNPNASATCGCGTSFSA